MNEIIATAIMIAVFVYLGYVWGVKETEKKHEIPDTDTKTGGYRLFD